MSIELVLEPFDFDPLWLDSIFERPGRNDPCHCGSDKKYKKCHEEIDEAAWRAVRLQMIRVEIVCRLLRMYPSNHPEYDLPPEEIYDGEEA